MTEKDKIDLYEILVYAQSLHDAIEEAKTKVLFKHKIKYIAKTFKDALFDFVNSVYEDKQLTMKRDIYPVLELYNKFNNLPLLVKCKAVEIGEQITINKCEKENLVVLTENEYDNMHTLLKVLKQGAEIKYPSGFLLKGLIDVNYIEVGAKIDGIYQKDGLHIMNEEGLKCVLKDKIIYEDGMGFIS